MKPMVLPWSEDGRTAGRSPVAFISFVDRAREVSSVDLLFVYSLVLASQLSLYSAFWRLAIDAGSDSCRHRLGLAAHPRRNDRAEATGRAACSDDQKMVRRFERGMDAGAAV